MKRTCRNYLCAGRCANSIINCLRQRRIPFVCSSLYRNPSMPTGAVSTSFVLRSIIRTLRIQQPLFSFRRNGRSPRRHHSLIGEQSKPRTRHPCSTRLLSKTRWCEVLSDTSFWPRPIWQTARVHLGDGAAGEEDCRSWIELPTLFSTTPVPNY